MRGLIGRKLGMTQVFDHVGNRLPVTVVQLGPCTVLRKKEAAGPDGYGAAVLGFEEIEERKLSKPLLGQFKAVGVSPKRHVREFRMPEHFLEEIEAGDELTAALFQAGDVVDIVGQSKGRGFAGVMKRHNQRGGRKTHGVHEYYRHQGSIGMGTWPGRVLKGKSMPGQMGNARVTTQNLRIVAIDHDSGTCLVHGSVPGPQGGIVYVTAARKKESKRAKA